MQFSRKLSPQPPLTGKGREGERGGGRTFFAYSCTLLRILKAFSWVPKTSPLTDAADPVVAGASAVAGAAPLLALLPGVAGAVLVARPDARVVREADHAEQAHVLAGPPALPALGGRRLLLGLRRGEEEEEEEQEQEEEEQGRVAHDAELKDLGSITQPILAS